jgi:hypothetical protein
MTPAALRSAAMRAGLHVAAVHGSGKATRLFGRLPLLPLYGSYLAGLKPVLLPADGDFHPTKAPPPESR